jgi:hypothetical protein
MEPTKGMNKEIEIIETLFSIQTKDRLKIPYKLNPAQSFMDSNDNPDGRVRMIIAKARQKGFSSIILAKMATRCLSSSGTRAVCVSHESDATQRLLDKVDYYLKHIKGPSPVFGRHSRQEMYFEKMESTFYIGTAGAKAFGRGDTISDLHCSEYAFWDDPIKHSAGLFQAVPFNGRIYIESTGNGRNNDFYYIWKNAEKMNFTRIFYPWYADDEYALDLPDNIKEWKPTIPKHTQYLWELKTKLKLSDRQMNWYELKLGELRENLSLMQQEYPSEPEECFQSTGGAIFPNAICTPSNLWIADRFEGKYINKLKGHPNKNYHYVIGADPSGGTGNDDAAFNIFCIETWEQVFEFADAYTNPIDFAEFLCIAGKMYNDAFIVCEKNNHGAAVVPYLERNYNKAKLFKRKNATKSAKAEFGWLNSQTSKHALVGAILEDLSELTIYGELTVGELKGFEENADGKMGGKSDNTVIAVGLGMLGLQKYLSQRKTFLTPLKVVEKININRNYMYYSIDDILNSLPTKTPNKQVGKGYPR